MAKYEWEKQHKTGVSMNLMNNSDADIITWLSKQKSKQAAIKTAIRFYIAHKKDEENEG